MSTTELEKPKAQVDWPDFPPGIPVIAPELLQQAIEEADWADAEELLVPASSTKNNSVTAWSRKQNYFFTFLTI